MASLKPTLGLIILLVFASPSLAAGPPRPPSQMSQLDFFAGRWRCRGMFHGLPGVAAHRVVVSMRVKLMLDGHRLVLDYVQQKTKVNLFPYKARRWIGYDQARGAFVIASADNMGSTSHLESKGWKGKKWAEQGHTLTRGRKSLLRRTYTKTGKKKMAVKNEIRGPNGWVVIAEEACSK